MAIDSTPTHQIAREMWPAYLENLTRQYQGWQVSVEVISMEVGDQPMVENQQLWAISWDPRGPEAGGVLIETGNPEEGLNEHFARGPVAVREANTLPGYEADVQIETSDGAMTIVRIRRRPELPAGRSCRSAFGGRRSWVTERRSTANSVGPVLIAAGGLALAWMVVRTIGQARRSNEWARMDVPVKRRSRRRVRVAM